MAIQFIVNLFVKSVFRDWHNALSKGKKAQLPGYVASLVHHCYVAPVVVGTLFSDYIEFTSNGNQPVAANHLDFIYSNSGIASFVIGYFIADTLGKFVLDGVAGHKVFLFHHVVSLYTVHILIAQSTSSLCVVLPVCLCCEVSSIFFNTAWVLRAVTGTENGIIVLVLDIIFVVTFVIFRNISLSVLIYSLGQYTREAYGLVGQFAFALTLFLQFFWLGLIFKGLWDKGKSTIKDDKTE